MRRFLILLLLLTIPLVCRGDGWFYGSAAPAGAATVTRESYAEHAVVTGDTTYAWTVTIPSNTTAIILAAAGCGWTGNPIASANLNESQNFSLDTNLYTNGERGVGIAHLFSPGSTGSQTINITLGAHGYDIYVYLVFYSGTATDGFRDTDSSATTSLTLTTESGDVPCVIATDETNTTMTWTNATEFDEYTAPAAYCIAIADMTADGTSETISTSGSSNHIAAVVLKPGS